MSAYDVIVIGAGPAGLLAAGRAAERGKKVLVLEKMRGAGRKLLITGSGRCNITNNNSVGEFVKHVFASGKFLRTAFSKFFSAEILDLLQQHGVNVMIQDDGRYFPADNKSSSVLKALLTWVKNAGGEIRYNQKVEEILVENNTVKGVISSSKIFHAPNVILSTGGKSYPATGSTGEGYCMATKIGHSLVREHPALVSLVSRGNLAQQIQGLNLYNVKATIWVDNKKISDASGEMIFTHFGLSGPIILTLSRIATDALFHNKTVDITIDLKPDFNEQELDKTLQTDLNNHGKKKLSNILKFWLPDSMVPVFINLLKTDPEKECHQVSGKERKQIRNLIKNLPFSIIDHRGFKEAIITAGGIPTNEISPKTMESKLVKGLFFAGEIIDLDAETGGYNLQIAFSTGWLAGDSCK